MTKLVIIPAFIMVLIIMPDALPAQGIGIPTGGTIAITGAATIEINDGGLVNNGTYTKGTETMTFSGSTAQTVSGTNNLDMNSLSITNTGGLTTQLTLLTTVNLAIGAGSKFTILTAKAVTVSTSLANN